jgi:putative transposase
VARYDRRPGNPDTAASAELQRLRERFVRSVKEECLNCIVPLGERHLRKTLREFAAHYHRERNHQGLANELIDRPAAQRPSGVIHRRQRVGGIPSYYYRSAA